LDGVTAGTVTASKALVVDANKDIASLRNITATGAITGDVTGNVSGTAATVTTAAQPNITSLGTLTTLTVDDITINGSTISDAGDFTLDVGGDIILDANGGDIRFTGGGTQFAKISNTTGNMIVESFVSNADILFQGSDNGSNITALTLDMSDAGTAIFNHDIKVNDSGKGLFGSSGDLEVFHTGSHSFIKDGGTGNLYVQGSDLILEDPDGNNYIYCEDGGKVYLYYNGSNKLDTHSSGINIETDINAVNNIYLADKIYHEGDTDTYLEFHAANQFRIVTGGTEMLEVNDIAVQFGAAANLNGNNLTNVEDMYLRDKIYHDGDTDTYIGFESANEISFIAGGVGTYVNSQGVFIRDGSLAEDYDALSGTTPTCDVDSGGMFSLTMSGNTTFTFSGASSGYSQGFILQLTGNGSTVTYPASVDWAGGTAPDAPANGETDILVFFTRDGGTNWYGALALDAAA
jgi:hypothetical protein